MKQISLMQIKKNGMCRNTTRIFAYEKNIFLTLNKTG